MKLEKTFQTTKHAKYAKRGRFVSVNNSTGSVMLEFVIAFPLVLVLMFACIQFSELWIARMVVHYGAFCAARSALVCTSGEYNGNNSAPSRAATSVCALLWQSWPLQSGDRNSTTVGDDPTWNVTATHKYTFSLITPIVGQIMAWGMNPWEPNSLWQTTGNVNGNIDSLGYPTILLSEKVTLPKPYKTMVEANFQP
jgi:hypothetical protein